MTYPSQTVDAPTKPPGPRFAIALIVMLIGTVIGIGGLAAGIADVVHDVHNAASGVSPLVTTRQLSPGVWEVYAVGGATTVQPTDVRVTGPTGVTIPTESAGGSSNETITANGHHYDGAVRFTIPADGVYRVRIGGVPGNPVLLSRPLGDLAKHAGKRFAIMGVGILIGIVGVILWIVGASRRRSARQGPTGAGYAAAGYPPGFAPPGYPPGYQQPPAYPQPPTDQPPAPSPAPSGQAAPGWYADPEQPGSTRWWDGRQWTEHTNSP